MNTDGHPVRIGEIFQNKTEHWIIEREIIGLNGLGLPWIMERWKWLNGLTCRTQTLSLNFDEWCNMLGHFDCINSGHIDASESVGVRQ